VSPSGPRRLDEPQPIDFFVAEYDVQTGQHGRNLFGRYDALRGATVGVLDCELVSDQATDDALGNTQHHWPTGAFQRGSEQ
jgi:hypothetical protein